MEIDFHYPASMPEIVTRLTIPIVRERDDIKLSIYPPVVAYDKMYCLASSTAAQPNELLVFGSRKVKEY